MKFWEKFSAGVIVVWISSLTVLFIFMALDLIVLREIGDYSGWIDATWFLSLGAGALASISGRDED